MASKYLAALSLAACFLSVARAAVTFDPASGTGLVGKGDVQLAYGWNNQELQRNAAGVSLFYSATDSYDAVCEWVTGPERNRRTHTKDRTETTAVSSSVTYDTRVRNQITGFTLTGLKSTSTSGEVPEVGGTCPGVGTDGTWVSVELVRSTGGLYVSHEGIDRLIFSIV